MLNPPANIGLDQARISGTSIGWAYVPQTRACSGPLPPLISTSTSCSVKASSPRNVIALAISSIAALVNLSRYQLENFLPWALHIRLALMYPLGTCIMTSMVPYFASQKLFHTGTVAMD